MSRRALAAASLLLALLVAPSPVCAAETTTFALENGLQVTLKPLATGEQVAILVVYDIGEDHDPEGRSGLAHLVEHCYVTSAAGKTKQRTAEAFMKRYPRAWNAQTGMRYTVIAVMVPKESLAAELEEAAARMGALEITQGDLDREIPRMRVELANMFDSYSALAVTNRAWARARPSPAGGRKGGVIEQLEALTLEDVQAWHRKHYKPGNARLVLVGPFEEVGAKTLVEKHFGPIAKGEAPVPRAPGEPMASELEDTGRRGGWVARAWRAPASDDDAYPAFLILARRILAAVRPRGTTGMDPFPQFAPLDHPEVISIARRVVPEETSAEAAEAIDAWLLAIADEPLHEQEGLATARDFAFLLGTMPLPDAHVAANPYGAAFGIARCAQLGLDGSALARRLAAVDQAAFEAMVEEVFGAGKGAAAAVMSPHPAR